MKLIKLILFIILVFNFFSCSNKETTGGLSEQVKQDLMEAINKFNQAFQEGDVTTLESMIVQNYIHTNGNSKPIGKKDWINYLHKRNKEIESKDLEVKGYKMEEIQIEFYDNTAIMTAKITAINKRSDQIQENEYRVTNIWVYEMGNWKRAGFHDGKIK